MLAHTHVTLFKGTKLNILTIVLNLSITFLKFAFKLGHTIH